jgi:hypothetical protein
MEQNKNKNINNSIKQINKIYDKLTYFDLYGTSVLCFIIISIIVFLVYSYSVVMLNSSAIKDDWVNQRCNPKVIPFAGFINKPENQSIIDYTGDNFSYCIQDILTKITGYAVQPFNYLINFLSSIFDELKQAINIIRDFLSSIRTKFGEIAEEILSRILNTLIPVQQIFIALNDSFAKSQAVLTSGLYLALGSYYTFQSLMGAIAQLIIEILITLAAIIVVLWIVPFTWSIASTMTLTFIAIAIPLAIMVLFMTEVLHVQTEGIPSVPSCLDKNTNIQMFDGTFKPIQNIELGDILSNNNRVTAKIKVNAKGLQMFKLHDIIVSGTHIVKYKNNWIKVKDHPESQIVPIYKEPFLYCLNTTNKIIIINDVIFTDWDEIYEDNLEKILQVRIDDKFNINDKTKIHYYLDNGFDPNKLITLSNGKIKFIKDIKIGDILLHNNDIVYGLVEIDATNLYIKTDKYLGIDNNKIMNHNKLYHLLTYSNKFTVDSIRYNDYNSLIDINLVN